MGVYSELPDTLREVDIVIVGGGTAGCVVSSRLSDADPNLSILVVEAGPNNENVPESIYLGLYRANFAPESPNFQIWQSVEEDQLAGRGVSILTGSMLGGGSSVNAAIYARAQHDDFNGWKAKGWSGDDMVPFLKKIETYYGEDALDTHGHDGPIKVSDGRYRGVEIERDFLSAMAQAGYPTVEDVHDLYTVNAGAHSRRYVSPQEGRRQDAAHTYLHPRLQDGKHPNLNVLVGAQVTRVLFDTNKKATGIEFKSNPRVPGSGDGQVSSITARRLVVVSAGTFDTPTLLERSGVGDREILDRAGVPVTHELPGVGHGFQDHQSGSYVYNSKLPVNDTWESIYNGARNLTELVVSNDKILSWNGCDAAGKLRPTESDIDRLGPQFRKIWTDDYQRNESKPLAGIILINGILGDPSPYPAGGSYFTLCAYTAYPQSRGSVHITSPNIGDPVEWKSGYLSDPDDFDAKTQVWAYKKQREVARNMALFDNEISSENPAFAAGSPAASGVEYSAEDDVLIEEFVRTKVGTTWHPLGTCKMAPLEEDGVVDESLKVHGLANLRIADLSIAPANVAANTMNTALVIGEKAADIFIRELGLGSC
ncbi:GMC oxidoreductase [Hypomontagnella submonticulosa]|nr:GMC oxidoreductase [Hypomontagnella submonticulosa]